jgi:predicted amidohydrolase
MNRNNCTKSALLLMLAALFPLLGAFQEAEIDEKGKSVKVAICQIFCLDGDRAGNLVRMENALEEAAAGGAKIACFPETAFLGWVNPAAHERAQSIPGKDTGSLAALARKYGLWICCGLAEKEEDKLYDAAVLIDPEGRVILKHRKINVLTELMEPPYTPGSGVHTVDTSFGRVGLLICADTFKVDLLKRLAALRPDLVLVPYGWAAPEDWWPGHGKALENTVCAAAKAMDAAVVGTDLVGEISHGPWKGYVYGGLSLAADREGKVLATCRDRDRQVMILELKLREQP